MANLREVTGRSCVSHNLGMSAWSERDVDRVAGLGAVARELQGSKAGDLGVEVWRWAYALDQRSTSIVLFKLAKLIGERFPMDAEKLQGVAKQAMREFVDWACPVCAGRKHEQLANGVVIMCEPCNGTGLKRYSNADRVAGTGLDVGRVNYRKVVERPLEYAIGILRVEDERINKLLKMQLERRK